MLRFMLIRILQALPVIPDRLSTTCVPRVMSAPAGAAAAGTTSNPIKCLGNNPPFLSSASDPRLTKDFKGASWDKKWSWWQVWNWHKAVRFKRVFGDIR